MIKRSPPKPCSRREEAWKLPEGEEVKWIGEKSKDGRCLDSA